MDEICAFYRFFPLSFCLVVQLFQWTICSGFVMIGIIFLVQIVAIMAMLFFFRLRGFLLEFKAFKRLFQRN
jgi:hypothetical protein